MVFVSYLRVSTTKQADSGLGIEAQRAAIAGHVKGAIIAEFVEIESGKRNDRPQLAAALAACRRHRAVLAVGKLDRLARNVAFVSNLMESGVEFIAVDNPHATRLTIHILAAVAENERAMISARTIAALAAAKARGTILGSSSLARDRNTDTRAATAARAKAKASADEDLRQVVGDARSVGDTSIRQIAEYLTIAGVPTPRGGSEWSFETTRRLIARLDATAI